MTVPIGAATGEGHPRPQLVRREWHDLSGTWQFAYDDADVGRRERWYDREDVWDRIIVVPFPPESPASGIGDRSRHDLLWYRRTFEAPESLTPEHDLLLHFGAVDYAAQVWVNGHLVARHEGGHTPFTADITDVLVEGEQVLVVRAEDRLDDRTQPRGKQFWREEPVEFWYHRSSGIWQPVWLEPVPRRRVQSLRWTPDVDSLSVELNVTVTDTAVSTTVAPPRLRARLSLGGRTLVDGSFAILDTYTERRMTIPRAVATELTELWPKGILWDPAHPHLIDVELTLTSDDAPIDEVHSYFGMRTVGTGDGFFRLNERPFYLRMVLAQGYWPESQMAAPSGDALRREVELIKELGFNGVRMHQKVEDPRFLYWCDRLGLIVWAEMPAAYLFTRRGIERFGREWLQALHRDYNHPSVAVWVPFNESWGVLQAARSCEQRSLVKAMYELAHAVDSTRPVIGNDGWEHVVTDIWSIHDYAMQGAALRERYGDQAALERTLHEAQPNDRALSVGGLSRSDQPVMLTEFGGISYNPDPAPERALAYAKVRDCESFLLKYEELVGAVLGCSAVRGFCYTQLADMEQEANGLLTGDRRHKADPARIAAANLRPSQSRPGELMHHNMRTQADVSPLPGP